MRILRENVRLLPGRVGLKRWQTADFPGKAADPGGFSIYNAMAALGCGLALGLELGRHGGSACPVEGVKGRVEVVPVPADYTVVIDYAPRRMRWKTCWTPPGVHRNRILLVFGCGETGTGASGL